MAEYSTVHTQRARVRISDTGGDGMATLAAMADYFQDAATLHARSAGYGRRAMMSGGLVWVLNRLFVRMGDPVSDSTELEIATWPADKDKYLAYREYVAMGPGSRAAAKGSSAWATIDLDARRMVRLPEDFVHDFPSDPPERVLGFPSKSIPRLRDVVAQASITARHSDLDIQGHVNNVRYIEWVLEPLDQGFVESHRLVGLDIAFRAECRAGDELAVRCGAPEPAEDGEVRVIHAIERPADGTEAIRAASFWTPRKG